MTTVTRRTLGELHQQFELYDPQFTIYRGLSNVEHKLIPTLGRIKLKKSDTVEIAENKKPGSESNYH